MTIKKKDLQFENSFTNTKNEGWIMISPNGKMERISENKFKKIKKTKLKHNENSRKRKFN
jgi:predicted ester cyclase